MVCLEFSAIYCSVIGSPFGYPVLTGPGLGLVAVMLRQRVPESLWRGWPVTCGPSAECSDAVSDLGLSLRRNRLAFCRL